MVAIGSELVGSLGGSRLRGMGYTAKEVRNRKWIGREKRRGCGEWRPRNQKRR